MAFNQGDKITIDDIKRMGHDINQLQFIAAMNGQYASFTNTFTGSTLFSNGSLINQHLEFTIDNAGVKFSRSGGSINSLASLMQKSVVNSAVNGNAIKIYSIDDIFYHKLFFPINDIVIKLNKDSVITDAGYGYANVKMIIYLNNRTMTINGTAFHSYIEIHGPGKVIINNFKLNDTTLRIYDGCNIVFTHDFHMHYSKVAIGNNIKIDGGGVVNRFGVFFGELVFEPNFPAANCTNYNTKLIYAYLGRITIPSAMESAVAIIFNSNIMKY